MSTEQQDAREQQIEALAEKLSDAGPYLEDAREWVTRVVTNAEQAAERRGAERGWDEGVQAHTAHLYAVKFGTAAAGGMAPNPYRSAS